MARYNSKHEKIKLKQKHEGVSLLQESREITTNQRRYSVRMRKLNKKIKQLERKLQEIQMTEIPTIHAHGNIHNVNKAAEENAMEMIKHCVTTKVFNMGNYGWIIVEPGGTCGPFCTNFTTFFTVIEGIGHLHIDDKKDKITLYDGFAIPRGKNFKFINSSHNKRLLWHFIVAKT